MINMLIPGTSMKKVSILIIDDDEEDYLIIKQHIGQIRSDTSFHIKWCDNYRDGLEAVCGDEHDIYFVDFLLGEKTGLELIKEAVNKHCEQPIVLLTGAGNQHIDLQAMQAGASDYLVKSELTAEKLERCIRYAVTRHEFLRTIRENEQKYRGIFEKTKDFIFTADEALMFKEVNRVGTSLFGYSAEAFATIGLPDLLLHDADGTAIREKLAQAGGLDDFEIELRGKNSQVIHCILSLSVEKHASGEPYVQGIIHDITVLKNAEKANLQTAKLNATERLVRTLAHEVRNPLNNIILAVEQLQELPLGKEKVYLDIVTRNSDRINNLITELLYSSRPAVIELEKTLLETVLEKSIAEALDRFQLKKVALVKELRAPGAMIMADTEKLSMAFLNIIINGIEASPEKDGGMRIGLREERGDYVVSITDNGHGIHEDDLGKLFEPYFTSKSAGMGLGLTSALSIFESHRALVEVKSAPGAGTTFHVTLKKV